MGFSIIEISANDIGHLLESILYGDDDGFEESLENGFNEIEFFIDTLKESDKHFTLKKYTN